MKKILVIHGPNLGLLGKREPQIYGSESLDKINALISREATSLGFNVSFMQTNHEGIIIDAILEAPDSIQGIIMNPGAFAHTSLAIADSIRSIDIPVVEVHLSNIFSREAMRSKMIIGKTCRGVIAGFGSRGYIMALQWFAKGRD